ncbi:HNH/endonuclease VII fold putative polymorphic toxin [Shouchella miscanthi]|uniref:HNH/endonuclease VII fold putative polymorphic toxin n=1 Tax=Shouchella miscanthi TaxID=2598861 RepID=UPI0024831B42|nr:HNH/endonuclease VII fold putative polymorphic toxin [Shouchella miscanthi]
MPVSSQPTKVTGARYKRGNHMPGKTYHFGKKKILWHPAGHYYGVGSKQNRGRHFNDSKKNHYNYYNLRW